MSISQKEFEALMSLDKEFVDDTTITLDENWTRDLRSLSTKDTFQLDYRRNKIEVRKYSFNHRTKTSIVLFRYCSLKRHTNPDGEVFDGPHIHIYCEKYGDRVAMRVQDVLGIDPEMVSREQILEAILNYCHIKPILIQSKKEI